MQDSVMRDYAVRLRLSAFTLLILEELELNVQGPSTLNFGASQKPVSMKAGMAKKQGV